MVLIIKLRGEGKKKCKNVSDIIFGFLREYVFVKDQNAYEYIVKLMNNNNLQVYQHQTLIFVNDFFELSFIFHLFISAILILRMQMKQNGANAVSHCEKISKLIKTFRLTCMNSL